MSIAFSKSQNIDHDMCICVYSLHKDNEPNKKYMIQF